ncbi:MAG: carboxypeptidase-like regulatory domain-containing protein [Bacteroidota bacterium]
MLASHSRLFLLSMLLSVLGMTQGLWAQPSSLLDQPLIMTQKQGTVLDLLTAFSEQSGILLGYSSGNLDTTDRVIFSGKEKTVADYLQAILQNQPIRLKHKQDKILLIPHRVKRSKTFTVSGYVREKGSKESLISASVSIPTVGKGVYTNSYGFFSLSLPRGTYQVRISYIGYQERTVALELNKDQFFALELEPDFSLEEILIVAEDQEEPLSSISTQEIRPDKLEALPMLLGQRDVVKQMQLLPGVQSMNEGISGLVVRGGNPDQNLMLLDDVPIYNPSHSLGLFSVFYGDAIQKSTVMKGAFPAEVGGRLSSVVDVRMKEGNKEAFHGDISTGFLTGTIRLEGPIRKKKGKTSFHLSARRTLLDLLTNSIQLRLRAMQVLPLFVTYHFQDVNLKINHQFSSNTQLYFSTYVGNDRFRMERFRFDADGNVTDDLLANTFLNWGNRTVSLRLNQVLSAKWFLNATAHVSNYDYVYSNFFADPLSSSTSDTSSSGGPVLFSQTQIQDVGTKVSLDYYPIPAHQIKMGIGYIYHRYSPFFFFSLEEDGLIDEIPDDILEDKTFGEEGFAYIQDSWKINPHLHMRAGLRATAFLVDRASYIVLQPRLSLSWQVSEGHQLGFSFSRMVQFSHLLTTPGIGLPSDLWVPSTNQIRPQQANHFNFSYIYRPKPGWKIQLEAYYKRLENLLDYEQDLSFQSRQPNENWEDLVTVGRGWGYGLEAQIEKKRGKTTGWLAYSLGWSKRQFDGINDGDPFPYRFDRRHDLTATVIHKPKAKREFGLVWIYASGQAVTLGQQRFASLMSPIPIIPLGPRNAYRAPAYHRLDASVSFHKAKKRGTRTWVFGLYNLYNQQNPLFLSFRPDDFGELQLYQQSLLPLIPYATYRFRF